MPVNGLPDRQMFVTASPPESDNISDYCYVPLWETASDRENMDFHCADFQGKKA